MTFTLTVNYQVFEPFVGEEWSIEHLKISTYCNLSLNNVNIVHG